MRSEEGWVQKTRRRKETHFEESGVPHCGQLGTERVQPGSDSERLDERAGGGRGAEAEGNLHGFLQDRGEKHVSYVNHEISKAAIVD